MTPIGMIMIGNIKTGFGIKVERINASARNKKKIMHRITILSHPGATGLSYGSENGTKPNKTFPKAKGIIRFAVINVITNMTARFFMLTPSLL